MCYFSLFIAHFFILILIIQKIDKSHFLASKLRLDYAIFKLVISDHFLRKLQVAHIANGWVRRIWEGCSGATEDRQVSSFSEVCRKVLLRVQNIKWLRRKETRNKIQSTTIPLPTVPVIVVQLWLLEVVSAKSRGGILFQPKVGVKLCWWQFSTATLEAPPICLRFLCPSGRRYMVGWRWSGNSTSTSKAFPWGALAWKICA